MKNLEADLSCPNCRRNMKTKIAEMYRGNKKICPSCRSEISFTGDDGRKAQKALDDFEKSLKNIFK